VRNLKEKRPLLRLRRTWEDNIRIDLKEIGRMLIGLMWLRIREMGGSYEHGNESSGSRKEGNLLTTLGNVTFSRRSVVRGVTCLMEELKEARRNFCQNRCCFSGDSNPAFTEHKSEALVFEPICLVLSL
jgi:hypothetical protein